MNNLISITDYVDAVRSQTYAPGGALIPVSGPGGMPLFESGQQSVVFKLAETNSGKFKALKFFFQEKASRLNTLSKISTFLANLDQHHLVSFEYKDQFIFVDGVNNEEDGLLPGLLMDWAQGETLGTFLADLLERADRQGLNMLVKAFKELAQFILANDFGHGDLKHDNIIVSPGFTLKLIDYDGVFIPGFKGMISEELGTDSFQHPKRSKIDFSKDIDHFSILSMFISLVAISIDPSLYARYNDGQNLLFTKENFFDLENSALYKELVLIPELKNLLILLRISLRSDNIHIDGLSSYIENKFPIPIITVFKDEYRVVREKKVEISFSCKDFQDLEIYQEKKRIPVSSYVVNDGEVTLRMQFQRNTWIRIVATGTFGWSESEIRVLTSDKLSFVNMKFSKSVIEPNDIVTCTFEAKHYRSVKLRSKNDRTILIPIPKGTRSFDFQPLISDDYYLEFTDLMGDVLAKGTKQIAVCSKIVISYFKADMNYTMEDIPVELSWNVNHADSVFLIIGEENRLDVSNLSSLIVSPIQDTTYVLECRNKKFRSMSQVVQVIVRPNEHKLSLRNLLPDLGALLPGKLLEEISLDEPFQVALPDLNLDNEIHLQVVIDENLEIELFERNRLSVLVQKFKKKITNFIKKKSE